jgi:hypothetical protein
MANCTIRFTSFPLTEHPPEFVNPIVAVFRGNESKCGTLGLAKGLTSNEVLSLLRPDLKKLGFMIEAGQMKADRIERPVFFGENGSPELQYKIDAYHPDWKCGLEVEAGRAWMGNAVYRDLIQALVMVDVNHLVLAVPNRYRYTANGKSVVSTDYDNTVAVAKALYGHSRLRFPYGLTVVGY